MGPAAANGWQRAFPSIAEPEILALQMLKNIDWVENSLRLILMTTTFNA